MQYPLIIGIFLSVSLILFSKLDLSVSYLLLKTNLLVSIFFTLAVNLLYTVFLTTSLLTTLVSSPKTTRTVFNLSTSFTSSSDCNLAKLKD